MSATEWYRDAYANEERASRWCEADEPTLVRRIELFRSHLAGSDRVLDYGCGTGKILASILESSGASGIGYDASESGIQLARKLHPAVEWRCGTAPLPEPDHSFTVIMSSEVLEHVYETRTLMAEFSRLLHPRGKLLLTVPYHGWLKDAALLLTGRMEGHYHDPHSEHIRYYSRHSLRTLLQEHGFEEAVFRGVGRLPLLWRSMFVVAVPSAARRRE